MEQIREVVFTQYIVKLLNFLPEVATDVKVLYGFKRHCLSLWRGNPSRVFNIK